ncbi:GDSL esterase/lipase 1-like isoform X1 [Diospyros lotus]|uniref:GDSL esterase/lipase 1-like isoform X1 n=1 Tax=Diospyros lotus TaxID=55363 RepID=UPI00225988DD|nr:GDSL esterase/lipase 1-like isoform X1 [Diospyros lotus]
MAKHSIFLQILLFVHCTFFIVFPGPGAGRQDHRAALFVFGDSLFDVGNNNYINTSTTFQANFWPYGQTFFKYPTGRLIPDFIAEYADLPLLPPYKHPGNHRFVGGLNFASSGAGVLPETYQELVIDIHMQALHFKKTEELLEQQLGGGNVEAKRTLLSRAVYLFSVGANDYVSPFWTNTADGVFHRYSREEYVGMVIGNLTLVITEIHKAGGRKFGFVGLAPMGCAPMMRAVSPTDTGDDSCYEDVNALIKLHNAALSQLLRTLESELQGFKYSLFDFYTSAMERINNPSKYGFKEGKHACCGSGPYGGFLSCGEKRGLEYELCGNPSEYVFFDLVHPSDTAYEQFSELMWSGPPSVVWPNNLRALFESSVEDCMVPPSGVSVEL